MIFYVLDRLQSLGGRVFVAGDAAHTMPPTGGLGEITGIGVSFRLQTDAGLSQICPFRMHTTWLGS